MVTKKNKKRYSKDVFPGNEVRRDHPHLKPQSWEVSFLLLYLRVPSFPLSARNVTQQRIQSYSCGGNQHIHLLLEGGVKNNFCFLKVNISPSITVTTQWVKLLFSCWFHTCLFSSKVSRPLVGGVLGGTDLCTT